MHRYNWHRPHASLDSQTPISRIGTTSNNLLRITARVHETAGAQRYFLSALFRRAMRLEVSQRLPPIFWTSE